MSHLRINRPIYSKVQETSQEKTLASINLKMKQISELNRQIKTDCAMLYAMYLKQKKQWTILHKAELNYFNNRRNK
jgi:hypothetical protein